MSLTARIYLHLDQQAARFERDAELAAKPSDRARFDRIAARFEQAATIVDRLASLREA